MLYASNQERQHVKNGQIKWMDSKWIIEYNIILTFNWTFLIYEHQCVWIQWLSSRRSSDGMNVNEMITCRHVCIICIWWFNRCLWFLFCFFFFIYQYSSSLYIMSTLFTYSMLTILCCTLHERVGFFFLVVVAFSFLPFLTRQLSLSFPFFLSLFFSLILFTKLSLNLLNIDLPMSKNYFTNFISFHLMNGLANHG